MATVFLLTLLVSIAVGQDTAYVGKAIQCKRPDGVPQRCMPEFENAAFDKEIVANNTCGLTAPEQYCVQTGTSGAKKVCDFCDDRNPGRRHPASLMTDFKQENNPTWWQSETLLQTSYGVHLILDLKKTYNVAFIRIRFHTIRPHSFAIHKKSTYDPREDWSAYQFYSRTCMETYGVENQGYVPKNNQKVALCTDEYSGMIPLSGGNVAYLTLHNRPGKNEFDQTEDLQEWVTVRSLKIDLDRLNTFGDEVFKDPKVLKSYYFAVSDIAVGGRCKCNGHASSCSTNAQGESYCDCDHNTAGVDCEKCLPLFNDRPWRAAKEAAYPCQACDCSGLADECVFDEQLWVDSNQRSGGRCINCQRNTAGIHCERCKDFHYRREGEEACKPCGCNKVGSLSMSCNDEGHCVCKQGVTGAQCDQCKDGYFDFSQTGCRKCNCDAAGSESASCDATGQCRCKANVEGKKCDTCKNMYFDLDAGNPDGCKPCFCYGHGESCTSNSGVGRKRIESSFDSNADDWTLEDEFGNDYSRNMAWEERGQYLMITPIANKNLYLVAPKRYLGNRLSSYTKEFSFMFGIFANPQNVANNLDLSDTSADIIWEGRGERVTFPITAQNNQEPTGRFVPYKYKVQEPEGMETFDFQKMLSDVSSIKIRVTYLQEKSAIDSIALQSTQYVVEGSGDEVTWEEKCEDKIGHLGEECAKGFTRKVPGSGPLGKCVKCSCHNHSETCDGETGKCVCQHNTNGDNCEKCEPGYYGNPTNGQPDDCKKCPCLFSELCNLINDQVKCSNCPEGHTGDLCELCEDSYFGMPNASDPDSRCKKCECNDNIDLNAIGNCDRQTGECQKCIHNTVNGDEKKCELCLDGYYGDALAKPKANCTACNCFVNGTKKPADYKEGDLLPCNSEGKCECLDGVIGDRCDQCPATTWNVGNGCEACACDELGSEGDECDITIGQCQCKPGVTGKKCDRCIPGYHSFSDKGCEACNCNTDGSVDQNCNEKGECKCLEGVLGVKCDQCPENKFNLSAGCIACPKCYDIVDKVVNELRKILNNFKFENTTNSTSVNVKDTDFEAALNKLKDLTDKLAEKVNGLNEDDKALYDFFKSLELKYSALEEDVESLEKMLIKSKGAAQTGDEAEKKADEIIEQIKQLLKEAEDRLVEETGKLVGGNGNSTNLNAAEQELKEIARKARELADKHENEADEITNKVKMAVNTSKRAYNEAKDAYDTEVKLNDRLKEIGDNSAESLRLAAEAEKFLDKAKTDSNEAHKISKEVMEEAEKPLPDYMVEQKKDHAEKTKADAQEVGDNSTSLLKTYEKPIEEYKVVKKEAEDLMERARKLVNESESLYQTAKNASVEAIDAQAEGAKVAQEAQDMLKDLLEFNENIKRSKANATEAKKLIPLIRQLIDDANTTGAQASADVDTSIEDANMSLNISQTAHQDAEEANNNLDDIIAQIRALLKETNEYETAEVADTKTNITEVANALDEYAKRAAEDADVIEETAKKASEARDATKKAESAIAEQLTNVEELVATIEGLGSIDLEMLIAAEENLQNATAIIEGEITEDLASLSRRSDEQEKTITKYELDLEPLRKMLKKTQQLYDLIPKDSCYKLSSKVETQG